jgi:hypothetical protein
MSGRILHFDGPIHHPAQHLLPWFVNGTLAAGERAEVETHLSSCALCRGEVDAQRAFLKAYRNDEAQVDTEAALASMRLLLDAEDLPEPGGPDRDAGGGVAAGRAPRWHRAPALRSPIAWAAAIAVVFVGGAALWQVLSPATPGYRTLGRADAVPAGVARVAVVFDENVSESRLRSIVQSVDARIVDGPTVTGAYVLETSRPSQRATLDALRRTSGVRLAEPLEYVP